MTRRGSRARRRLGLAALAGFGALVAIGIAELLVRALRIGDYEPPKLLADDGTVLADLSQIARFFSRANGDAASSRTVMPPDFVAFGWYDRPRWNYFDADGRVEYRTNSLGFRDHEFALARRPDELRVLALGDSFTFGQGIQLDDSWPQVLERGLARTRAGPVEVVNGGYCGGFKPDQYAEWLAAHGLELDPDLVVVGVCLNDVFEHVPLYAAPRGSTPPLGGRSRVLTMVHRSLLRWRGAAPPPWNMRSALRTAPHDPEQFREGLLSMQRTLAPRGIALLVVVLPMMTQLDDHYPFAEVHALVRDFCAERGIACVDLLDRFLGRDPRELWVHPTDQHPNDVGHRLIAERILEWLGSHPLAPRAKR